MRKSSIPHFIQQTWRMLEDEHNWQTIQWSYNGASFQILDQAIFTQALLPHYFKHCNLSSFLRQLNMYNFHKRKNAEGNEEYFHKLFRHGHRELLIGIKRKPSEAEITAADELIRKFAPECMEQHPFLDEVKSPSHQQQTCQNNFPAEIQHFRFQLSPEIYFFPFFFHDLPKYPWIAQKKIKTNIIIQSPSTFERQMYSY